MAMPARIDTSGGTNTISMETDPLVSCTAHAAADSRDDRRRMLKKRQEVRHVRWNDSLGIEPAGA